MGGYRYLGRSVKEEEQEVSNLMFFTLNHYGYIKAEEEQEEEEERKKKEKEKSYWLLRHI